MAKKTEADKVKNFVANFKTTMDSYDNSRQQWLDDQAENFGYYMCDPKIVFGSGAMDSTAKRAPGAPSQYHFPLITEKVESLVAALNSDDLAIRYMPQADQDQIPIDQDGQPAYTMDVLTRMGNAGFEACKTLVGWHGHIHKMVKSVAIFDCHYLGVCVDHAKRFPSPMVDIVSYHPWQVFCTPGEKFEDADEVIVSKWVSREHLKAQYPEYADRIKEIPTFRATKEANAGREASTTAYGGKNSVPGYGNQNSTVDNNSVQVLERWKQDTSLVDVSRDEDMRVLDAERNLIDRYIAGMAEDGDIAALSNGKLYFDEYQYHDSHFIDHTEHLDEIEGRLTASIPVPMADGTVREHPAIDSIEERARLEQAMQALTAHIEMTDEIMREIPSEKQGMRPRFDGGWRQTCIIGDTILAFDGASIFYTEYGIQGPPLWEFELMGHPLYHKGPSYVRTLIDYNKILNSSVNQIIDNGRLFSNHSWWADEESLPDLEINNDPRMPIVMPKGKILNKDFGMIPAQAIPSTLFDLVGLNLSMAQATSAIHPALQGSKQSGVRSGTQQQSQVAQNTSQLQYKMTRIKPSLINLSKAFFKMVMKIPPDDAWVKPILDREMVRVDWDVLRKIDFAIDVVVKPGGVASAEERSQITLGFLQNFGPIMAEIGMLDVMMEFMAKSIKYTMPDMAMVIEQNVERIQQAQQEQQAKQQKLAEAEAGAQQNP